jgi:hypothetical protein
MWIANSLPSVCPSLLAINPTHLEPWILFWVNRMGNALAVTWDTSAANQVFSSAFWFSSFTSGKKSKSNDRGHHDDHDDP